MKWAIGIDEVGRGPLAGPVYVCAVMMKAKEYKKWRPRGLTDSKKMTAKAREVWSAKAQEMQQRGELHFAIGKASAKEIDTRGITKTIQTCINRALNTLSIIDRSDSTQRLYILLDGGLKAPITFKQQRTIIRGDMSERIISLASVIAKVSRDAYMTRLAKKYPQYDWHTNKGYGTKEHIRQIKIHGPTTHHRRTYIRGIIDK